MTYARTKRRIVAIETIADAQTKIGCKGNFVAQSDSIVELCDYVFYKIAKGGLVIAKLDKDFPMDSLLTCVENGYMEWSKLAILPDIGLIYVARATKDKEWRLIE